MVKGKKGGPKPPMAGVRKGKEAASPGNRIRCGLRKEAEKDKGEKIYEAVGKVE